jgi:uncharacterized coiled-coil DUF342 family protein
MLEKMKTCEKSIIEKHDIICRQTNDSKKILDETISKVNSYDDKFKKYDEILNKRNARGDRLSVVRSRIPVQVQIVSTPRKLQKRRLV